MIFDNVFLKKKAGSFSCRFNLNDLIPLEKTFFINVEKNKKKISKKHIINKINLLNFSLRNAYIHLKDEDEKTHYLCIIEPGPCLGNEISFRISSGSEANSGIELFIPNMIINDGKSLFIIPFEQIYCAEKKFTAVIGRQCYVHNIRQYRRFGCTDIKAEISFRNRIINGELADFTPNGLQVILNDGDHGTIDLSDICAVNFIKNGKLLYSGTCTVLRYDKTERILILLPDKIQNMSFSKKINRNPRLILKPSPKIIFTHPIIDRKSRYEITDFTNTGFSIEESGDELSLLPGMSIHNCLLHFSGDITYSCSVKVVYVMKKAKETYRYGFSITDMDIATYNRIFDIFINAEDTHANVTREIDMNALWEFFFESGFIYAEKYKTLSQFKDEFKTTYEKMYLTSPEIFGNYTYQRNGKIFGHVSIIKAYEKTWMIHHLAAKSFENKRTGIFILNHILFYFEGLYRLKSIGMDYMIFYFRPDNKFPNFFFGGFCRDYNNPKGCSMDCFAYVTLTRAANNKGLPPSWSFEPGQKDDVLELRNCYEKQSGGLMVDAFCLETLHDANNSIEKLYDKSRLKRKTDFYVLKNNGESKAFYVIDQSDRGINLSELLNCTKIIIKDNDNIPWDIVKDAADMAGKASSKNEEFPVMIYPVSYLESQGIAYEKKYYLWILNSLNGKDFSTHLKSMAKISRIRMIIKYLFMTLFEKK